jgi:Arc/MetJ-type ribon-helix-helix transcriptional regulator
MKTLTIRLPDGMAEQLERESRARHVSKSDVVRERLGHNVPSQLVDGSLEAILEASWRARVPARHARLRSPKKRRLEVAIRAKKLPR